MTSPVTEATGADLRDEALEKLTRRNKALIRLCQRVVVEIVLAGNAATADDLDSIDTGKRRRGFLGAVFRNLAQEGVIRATGYQPSRVARNHARPVGVWQCVDADRARQWLRDNPELDPPESKTETTR